MSDRSALGGARVVLCTGQLVLRCWRRPSGRRRWRSSASRRLYPWSRRKKSRMCWSGIRTPRTLSWAQEEPREHGGVVVRHAAPARRALRRTSRAGQSGGGVHGGAPRRSRRASSPRRWGRWRRHQRRQARRLPSSAAGPGRERRLGAALLRRHSCACSSAPRPAVAAERRAVGANGEVVEGLGQTARVLMIAAQPG